MPKMTTKATSSTPSTPSEQHSTTASSTFPFFGTKSSSNSRNNDDQRCGQCMTHLTSILTTMQSKPKILFEAMGVLQQQQQQQQPTLSLDSAANCDKANASRDRPQLTDGNSNKMQGQPKRFMILVLVLINQG